MNYLREFIDVSKKNKLKHNLTELNVERDVSRLHIDHSDWVAHLVRYGHASKIIDRMKPKTVLDVGCGRLNLITYLWRNRSKFHGLYTGIDLRATARWLDDCGYHGDIRLYKMDIVTDPVELIAQSDLVVCFEVLEHVQRDYQQELMNRLYAWTAPGGLCLFSTPNAGVSKSIAENHVGPEGPRERTYDEKVRMAETAGFTVERAWGTFAAITRLPAEIWDIPQLAAAKEYLPNSFIAVFAAASYPRESNNALFELRK